MYDLDENKKDQATIGTQTAQMQQPTPLDQNQQNMTLRLAKLASTINSGGGWFYWIAGLSLLNSVIALFNGSFSFVAGLGFTKFLDAAIFQFGSKAALVAMPINIFVAGIYVMFGYFALRRARWAFITGIVMYSVDTLLLLLVKDIIAIGFHIFALIGIYGGLKADTESREIEKQIFHQGQ